MSAEHTLHVSRLTCLRQQRLFSPVSFSLHAGELLLIEGANGSGKTSLLRMLTGLSAVSEGEIYWGNQLIRDAREAYTSHLHYIGHQNGLKLGLTVEENLQLMGCLNGMENWKINPLAMFGLDNALHTQANMLSAGQKRKLALLKLFFFPKKLWLLDEPITALDAGAQHIFLKQLEEHIQQGGMCIATSHHPLHVENIKSNTLRLEAC